MDPPTFPQDPVQREDDPWEQMISSSVSINAFEQPTSPRIRQDAHRLVVKWVAELADLQPFNDTEWRKFSYLVISRLGLVVSLDHSPTTDSAFWPVLALENVENSVSDMASPGTIGGAFPAGDSNDSLGALSITHRSPKVHSKKVECASRPVSDPQLSIALPANRENHTEITIAANNGRPKINPNGYRSTRGAARSSARAETKENRRAKDHKENRYWCPKPGCNKTYNQQSKMKDHIAEKCDYDEGHVHSLEGVFKDDGTQLKKTEGQNVRLRRMIDKQKQGSRKEDYVPARQSQEQFVPQNFESSMTKRQQMTWPGADPQKQHQLYGPQEIDHGSYPGPSLAGPHSFYQSYGLQLPARSYPAMMTDHRKPQLISAPDRQDLKQAGPGLINTSACPQQPYQSSSQGLEQHPSSESSKGNSWEMTKNWFNRPANPLYGGGACRTLQTNTSTVTPSESTTASQAPYCVSSTSSAYHTSYPNFLDDSVPATTHSSQPCPAYQQWTPMPPGSLTDSFPTYPVAHDLTWNQPPM